MPHERKRHLSEFLIQQMGFWPATAVLGLRQVGKSTLIRNQLGFEEYLTFDDEDVRSDAEASSKAFLAKHQRPLVLDEAQKVPKIFDALKSVIDRKRIPGQFILSGSSKFSSQEEIQESLTGRVALCRLFPLTLAEAHQKELDPRRSKPIHMERKRFSIEQFAERLNTGGMPIPLFTRDQQQKNQYWTQWINTSLGRDLKRVYGKGYDDGFAEKVLTNLVRLLEQGTRPDVAQFDFDSRKTNRYLKAFEGIFLVQRLNCHHLGVGRDTYSLADSGILFARSKTQASPDLTLSLVRIAILNEIMANHHYSGGTETFAYYKSRKGELVDLVWNNIPIKFISSLQSLGWEQRAVEGAMKTLGSTHGLLVGPTDQVDIPKKKGVGLVPWTFWS